MIIYLAIFLVIGIIYVATYDTEAARSKWLLFAIMLFLGLFVGLSDMLGGYDRYIYGNLFDSMCDDVALGYPLIDTSLFNMYPSEFGYDYINYLISFITHNRYIFILIYTLIIYALLFKSIAKYTVNYPFAVLVFMGLWFFFSFTYLRQVLAVATCWLAIEYAIQRKPLLFFAIVALAFTIHNSAVVFAPLYFVPVKKFSPWVVILVMAICLVVGLTSIPADIFANYGELTDSEKRIVKLEDFEVMVFRIEYLLEAILFLTVILWRYEDINEDDRRNVVLTNMAIIFCGILLVFVRSDNGGRLGWFYMMGVIATLTYFANSGDGKLYKIGILFISALLYLRILVGWGVMLAPYKTFFVEGHREGDYIYEAYEYDEQYDVDKLYR